MFSSTLVPTPLPSQVVCCRLTDVQKEVYKHLLSSKEIRHIFEGKQTNILSSIGALQKLCNHPSLLQEETNTGSSSRGGGGGGGGRGQSSSSVYNAAEIARMLPPEERTAYVRHTVGLCGGG